MGYLPNNSLLYRPHFRLVVIMTRIVQCGISVWRFIRQHIVRTCELAAFFMNNMLLACRSTFISLRVYNTTNWTDSTDFMTGLFLLSISFLGFFTALFWFRTAD